MSSIQLSDLFAAQLANRETAVSLFKLELAQELPQSG
jgi:hypothetical protein